MSLAQTHRDVLLDEYICLTSSSHAALARAAHKYEVRALLPSCDARLAALLPSQLNRNNCADALDWLLLADRCQLPKTVALCQVTNTTCVCCMSCQVLLALLLPDKLSLVSTVSVFCDSGHAVPVISGSDCLFAGLCSEALPGADQRPEDVHADRQRLGWHCIRPPPRRLHRYDIKSLSSCSQKLPQHTLQYTTA